MPTLIALTRPQATLRPVTAGGSTSTADFELYKDSYREAVNSAIRFAGQNIDYFTRVKADRLVDLVRRRIGDPSRATVLDVGCGIGATDAHLVDRVGRVVGVDLFEGVVERAREANPGAEYHVYDGRRLPLDDASVDLAFAICVVHHVPPASWPVFVAEMARVVRPGGLVAIIEHNPLNPLTRRVVRNC